MCNQSPNQRNRSPLQQISDRNAPSHPPTHTQQGPENAPSTTTPLRNQHDRSQNLIRTNTTNEPQTGARSRRFGSRKGKGEGAQTCHASSVCWNCCSHRSAAVRVASSGWWYSAASASFTAAVACASICAPPPPHARRGEPLLPHPHTLAPPPEPYPRRRRRRRCDLRRVRWICRRVGVGVGVGVGRVLERRRERNLKRGGRISMDGMDGWVETRRHETETETEMVRSLFKFSFCFLLVLRIKIWFYFWLLREIGAVELRWA